MAHISAENLKRNLDKAFGHPWHVIVGESYSFDIEYDSEFFHYFFYGPIAVLAFKVCEKLSYNRKVSKFKKEYLK